MLKHKHAPSIQLSLSAHSSHIRRQFFAVATLLLITLILSLTLTLVLSSSSLSRLITSSPQHIHAQGTDGTLNFQARLLTSSGGIVPDGTYNVEFKLYDQPSGGVELWTETRTPDTDSSDLHVQVRSGYLSAYLGDKTAFPTSIDWSEQLYLTMNIGGTDAIPAWDGEMTPRIRLTSVPRAFSAQQADLALDSEQLDGRTADEFVQLSPTSQQTGSINVSGNIQSGAQLQGASVNVSGNITSTTGTLSIQGSGNSSIAGNLGIGTTSPQTALDVDGGIRVGGTTVNLAGVIRWTGTDLQVYDGAQWTSLTDGSGGGTAGVEALNSLTGSLTLQGTANQITVNDNGTNTITLSLPQNISTTSDVEFNSLITDGTIAAGGSLSTSSTLSVTSTSTFDDTLTVTSGGINITGDSTFNSNVTVAANQSLTLTGGTTRPSSPTEGMMFYDTDTNRLLVYSNGKWQADRTTATAIVAASDSPQSVRDSADYVAGAASAQTEINAALTASAGGKVYLAEGTYTVDAPISIPNNTTLAGAGRGTLITIPDSHNASINVITNTDQTTGTGVTIQDLRIDGNRSNQTTGTMHGIYFNNMGGGTGATARQGAKLTNLQVNNMRNNGFWLSSISNNILSGNNVQGNEDGFELSSSTNNTFSGNIAQGNDAYGFRVGSNANNNTFSGNIAQGNGTFGFSLSSNLNNTLTGNTAQGNTTVGFYIFNSSNNTLTGNISEGNGFDGFWIASSSSNNTITNNTITGNGATGFDIVSSSNNLIASNRIHDNGGSSSSGHSIRIRGTNPNNNTISNNHITDTAGAARAISIEAGTGTMLSNNRFGTGVDGVWHIDGPINDAGTGTIYANQIGNNGAIINRQADSTEMFQLQAANGDVLLNADTTNMRIGIGTDTPSYALDVVTADAISARFSGRVIGANAVNNDEFVTLGQANTDYQAAGDYYLQGGNAYGETAVLGTTDDFGLDLITNDTTRLTIGTDGTATFAGSILPSTDDTYDLGSSTNRWRDLYLGPASLNIGTDANNATISYNTTDSQLELSTDTKVEGDVEAKIYKGEELDVEPLSGGEDKYVWSAAIGWIDLEPAGGGVMVFDDHLEGTAYNDTVGWISFGTHVGGGEHTYANTDESDYGVNRDPITGELSGYAYNQTTGFINMDPTDGGVTHDPVTYEFSGSAWSESTGFINFSGVADDSTSYTPVVGTGSRQVKAGEFIGRNAKLSGAIDVQGYLSVGGATTITTDSTAALRIQDTDNNVLFNADTTNMRIGIGTDTPQAELDVVGDAQFSGNLTVGAGSTLTLTGGDTASRPSSPTEGMMYYDTDTNRLLVYSNGKWQADRSTATIIVAPNNASQTAKDSADFVVPDAADNAQVAINAAIATLPASGGTIYLQEGTYIVSGSIELPSNTTLSGAGAGTVIQLRDGHDANITNGLVSIPAASVNSIVRDLKIDGNKAEQASGATRGLYVSNSSNIDRNIRIMSVTIDGTTSIGVQIGSGTQNVTLENSTITNVAGLFALQVDYTDGVTVKGNYIANNEQSGALLRHNVTFTENIVHNNGGRGISALDAVNVTIANNTITNNGADGIYSTAFDYGNRITGNYFSGNTGRAIHLQYPGDSIISHNIIDSTSATAILLDGSYTGNIVSDNQISVTSGSNTAISLIDSFSEDVIISGNNITHSGTGSGIQIANGVARTLLSNNFITATTRITDNGTNTIYSNQIGNNGAIINRQANSTEMFQLQAANGDALLNADTTNMRIGIGTDTPAYALDVVTADAISARFSGRVIGADAVNDDEFVTLGQLNAATGGGGVSSLNTLDGALTIQGTANQVTVSDNATDTITLGLPNNVTINTLTLTNALGVGSGGTGASSFTQYGILYGNDTATVGVTAAGTSGECLLATTGGAPVWGECGGGTGIGGGGTSNRLALFSDPNTLADSWLAQNASTLELDSTRNLSLLGGNLSVTGAGTFTQTLTVGTSTNRGELILHDGGTYTTTIRSGSLSDNRVFTLPSLDGSSGQCLKTDGTGEWYWSNCNNGSGSGGDITLQDTYDASGTPAVIETSSNTKHVIIRSGSGNNTDAMFQLQNASGQRVFTADTSNNRAVLGQASTLNGQLSFANDTNGNLITLSTGVTSSPYTLTLPTALGSQDQCLVDTTGTGTLGWVDCGAGAFAGVDDINSLAGSVTLQGTTNEIAVATDAGSGTITLSLPSSVSINTLSLSNALAVADGGTGATTAQGAINNISGLTTEGDLLFYDGINTTRLARGTTDQCLVSTGTSITWATCPGGGGSGVDTIGTLDAQTKSANGAVIDGTILHLQTADTDNPGLVSTGTQSFAGAKTFTDDTTIELDSTTALSVQNATSQRVLGVNTTAGSVLLGQGNSVTGTLVVSNASNTNTVTIQSGETSASYTLTLPTSAPSSGQCLVAGTGGQLSWGSCGGGGGGGTQEVRLVPEFAGGTLTADGTDNNGVMNADYDGTARRNYYQWTTSQTTSQDYDIVVNAQIPSDSIGGFANFSIDTWRDNNTDASATYDIVKRDGTTCGSGTLSFAGTTGNWQSSAISLSCTPAASEVLVIRIKTIASNDANVRIGDISYNYDN